LVASFDAMAQLKPDRAPGTTDRGAGTIASHTDSI
jgi:hypothetical protein